MVAGFLFIVFGIPPVLLGAAAASTGAVRFSFDLNPDTIFNQFVEISERQ